MKKAKVVLIYRTIFILAVVLNISSIHKYLTQPIKDWLSYTLSWAIMILALWGHHAVKKHLKAKKSISIK